MTKGKMKAWYDDIDAATLQRIKTYSAFNDAKSKNLMMQTMYEYREKEIQDFKETNHELAENCIARKKQIAELEKENADLEAQIKKMKCCGNCQKLRVRFDSKTNINILYCSDSDMKQIEVGFQMCCCKWEVKEND